MGEDRLTPSGTSVPRPAVPVKWRQRATISVHPMTLVMLDELCARFRTNRGRVVDKLVETVAACYKDGRLRCVTGGACTINRTDLPEVL
jgi:hypothetical protein